MAKHTTRKNTPLAKQAAKIARQRVAIKQRTAPTLEDTARAIGLPLSKVVA